MDSNSKDGDGDEKSPVGVIGSICRTISGAIFASTRNGGSKANDKNKEAEIMISSLPAVHRLISSSNQTTGNLTHWKKILDEVLASAPTFRERVCLVLVDSWTMWPAIRFGSFEEFMNEFKNIVGEDEQYTHIVTNIYAEYNKLEVKANCGIGYLFARETTELSLVNVPKNNKGDATPEGYWFDDTGDCGSVSDQLKAAYALATKCYQNPLDDSVSIGDSPSNDIGKSIDAEGVSQGLSYPDSTGAAVTPPKVDSLVGGKRKSGKSRKRKKSKRAKSNNHNVIGGCRVVNTPLTNELEKRDCMKRALHSLLNPKEKKMVISEPFPLPSDGGDVSISISNTWLMKYDMTLEPVTARYNKQGGLLYNLLQDLESRLVIKVVLTMCDGGIADHFIAYDGTTLHDVPHSIKPLRDDRKIPSKCLAIFKKLYPTKNYSAFQVTNVFELRTNLKIIKECDLLGP